MLRSINSRNRSKRDLDSVRAEIRKLESDLNNAMEVSNKCIADRYTSFSLYINSYAWTLAVATLLTQDIYA